MAKTKKRKKIKKQRIFEMREYKTLAKKRQKRQYA